MQESGQKVHDCKLNVFILTSLFSLMPTPYEKAGYIVFNKWAIDISVPFLNSDTLLAGYSFLLIIRTCTNMLPCYSSMSSFFPEFLERFWLCARLLVTSFQISQSSMFLNKMYLRAVILFNFHTSTCPKSCEQH